MQEVFLWTVLLSSVVEVIPCTFCTSQSCCALLHAVKRSFGTVGPGIPACVKCSLGTVGPGIPACVKCSLEQLGQESQHVWNALDVQWEQLGQASQPVWNVHWNTWARHSSLCEMFIVNGQARHPNVCVCVCELLIGNIWARHPSLYEMFIGTVGPGIPACVKCSLGTFGPGIPACVKCSLGNFGPGIPACDTFIGKSWASHSSVWNVHWKWLGQATQPVWNVGQWGQALEMVVRYVHREQLGQSFQCVWNIHVVHWEQLGQASQLMCERSNRNSWADQVFQHVFSSLC